MSVDPISLPFLLYVSVFTIPKPGANHSVDLKLTGMPIPEGPPIVALNLQS